MTWFHAKLATNNLPDLLLGFNFSLFRDIAARGIFMDINKEPENYTPDTIEKVNEAVPDKCREPDGKLYLMPGNTIPTND